MKLVKPGLEDLWFRQTLVEDPLTMSYNENWGGTIAFGKEKWADWHARWMKHPDRYYRYVVNAEGQFVGEAACYKDEDRYKVSLIIKAEYRHHGYGSWALEQLCEYADEHQIEALYDDIALENPSLSLFLKHGFTVVETTAQYRMVKKCF